MKGNGKGKATLVKVIAVFLVKALLGGKPAQHQKEAWTRVDLKETRAYFSSTVNHSDFIESTIRVGIHVTPFLKISPH
jgi:hypothetical protein